MKALHESCTANRKPIRHAKEEQCLTALVYSNTETICRGLLLLLKTVPKLSQIRTTADVEAALQVCETDNPALIIIDVPHHHTACNIAEQLPLIQQQSHEELCNPYSGSFELLKQLNDKKVAGRTIAFINNEQEAPLLLAQEIDAILLKGISAAKLLSTIEELLQAPE